MSVPLRLLVCLGGLILAWTAAGPRALAAEGTVPAGLPVSSDPLDWPHWRGPEQNGISRETGLIDRWDPATGENVLWTNKELGTRSTPIVMHGKLYVLCNDQPGTTREGEKVVCVDAATGQKLWENRFNVFLSDVPDTRVGWSCVVGDPAAKRVYAMGVCGYFQCLDAETGATIWKRSLNEEFGLLSTYGGRTNVPIVFEDLVIISAVMTNWGELAVPAHRFLAMNKHTGEVVWFNGTRLRPDDTTYSTPTLAVIGGQTLMIFGSGDGDVWAFQPRTGKPVWNYKLSMRGLNLTPLVVGDTVYMGQSEENPDDSTMGAMAAIRGLGAGDITATNTLWRNKQQMVGKSSPVLWNDRLYAADDSGILYILDPKTGATAGRKTKLTGAIMRASLLAADGRIYACTTEVWHVLRPTASGVTISHRLRFAEGEECHGSPIVSHGRIYLPTTSAIYCLGKADAQPASTPAPAVAQEAPASEDAEPAHVQVVPAESLAQPGDSIQFKVRLFNARGQFLRESEASYAVDSGGQINAEGLLVIDSVPRHAGAIVTAKVGQLSGSARVRIVPPLPWKFDFNEIAVDTPNPVTQVLEGEPPISWVGARYRHKIRELDGEKVMVKVTTIPKGTRSQSFMGPTNLHDFTIQADIRGAIRNAKMPDIGVIGQRYTLDLMGQSQQLQIRSWTAQLEHRFAVTVPYKWEPGKWYTLKLQTATDGPRAVLRGKVWPRGEPEPTAWTVEGIDEVGNLEGSPGLWGNANDAEIYLDNITVTPNP